MRFAAYEHQDRRRVAVVEEDGTLFPLPGVTSLTALIQETCGLPGLLAAGAAALDVPPGPHVSQVRLLPPLQPASVRDFVTFEEHVEGVRRSVDGVAGVPEQWYAAPTFYFTNPHAIYGPGDGIPVPPVRPCSTSNWRWAPSSAARAATSPRSRPATTSSATPSSTTGPPATSSPPR